MFVSYFDDLSNFLYSSAPVTACHLFTISQADLWQFVVNMILTALYAFVDSMAAFGTISAIPTFHSSYYKNIHVLLFKTDSLF